MTSAATAVAKQIAENPGSVTSVLAENLPKASNFFIPYFIVQGLGIASGILSQVVGFVIFTLMYKFLTGTPRASKSHLPLTPPTDLEALPANGSFHSVY